MWDALAIFFWMLIEPLIWLYSVDGSLRRRHLRDEDCSYASFPRFKHRLEA